MDGVAKGFFKYIITLAVGMFIGIVIGVISLNTLISYRIDEYVTQIIFLEAKIDEKDVKLNRLEESINKSKFILKNINIKLIYEKGDDIDKVTLIKHIKNKYNNLLGKEVKNIDIEMAAEVIDNRIMKIDDDEYKLNVIKVSLSDELKIWVKVK